MKKTVYEALSRVKEKRSMMSGIVKVYNPDIGLIIDHKNCKIIIPPDEIEAYQITENFGHLTSREVFFFLTEISKDEDIVIASRKAAQEFAYPRVIEALKSGRPVSGQIAHIMNYGAWVDIRGISVLLKNFDYSEDDTAIIEDYKIGDSIDVLFLKESEDSIHVTVPKKVKKKSAINAEDIKLGSYVNGKVTGSSSTGVFVKVPGGIDVLCEVPESFENPQFRDYKSEVSIVITKIRAIKTDDIEVDPVGEDTPAEDGMNTNEVKPVPAKKPSEVKYAGIVKKIITL